VPAATVRLDRPHAFPGGYFVISSSAFRGVDALPQVRINGAVSTEVSAAGGDSLIVGSPRSPGSYTIEVRLANGHLLPAGTLSVAGLFTGSATTETLTSAIAWPDAYGTRLVAASSTGGLHIVFLDLEAPSVTWRPLADSIANPACLRTPGVGVNNELILANYPGGLCSEVIAWERTDTAASGLQEKARGPYLGWGNSAWLGDNRWLGQTNHAVWRYRAGSVDQAARGDWNGRFLFSANRRRVAALGWSGAIDGGRPVFEVATGEVAYRLPDERANGAFSPTGDTLYVLADRGSKRQLYAVRGSDGRRLFDGDSFPSRASYYEVVVDSAADFIYVLGESGDNGPRVLVFDRATLRRAGEMTVPAGAPPAEGRQLGFVSQDLRRLFVLVLGGPTTVYSFDLPRR